MNRFITRSFIPCLFFLLIGYVHVQAQTNTVEFGQNRVQYKNFKWRFYTTRHFNTYFAQNGLELGKYVAQCAEKELPQLEEFMEFTFRQKVNIIVYNNFAEFKQSNVGIGVDWQNTGGVTKLVGNKLLVYFDGDHANLRRQIRQGIARVMLETLLFGEDIGEFAGNAVLIDFPNWFTDGFIAYAAENWNPQLDDQLKSVLNSGRYNTFNQLTFDKPLLAGQAFWYYVESKYGKDAVPYLMYITRINRGLKKGFEQVLHMKPKAAQADFMMWFRKRYQEDGRRRRQVTRGTGVISKELGKRGEKDYYRFQANPKNSMVALVEYSKGTYKVKINLGWTTQKVLLKSGVKQLTSKLDPNYPLLAWNQKGNRLAVVYESEGKTRLMIYDLISKITIKQDLPMFERIIDMKYFFEFDNSLLLSAVRNGHTDIFTYSITNGKVDQITNDVWDDLDPSFAAFPGKSGIIYSSNRPSPKARTSDTVMPHNRYNIFMVDNWNKSSEKQISQLTNLPYGNARLPVQYNTTHFTFVSDANGIANRYAGFFRAERAGVDSLYFVGAEILYNPDKEDLDSALMDYGATAPDSIQAITITNDSTYVFPVTNYSFGIKESRIAGDQGMVSEVVQIGDWKRLYKLKVDTNTLRKRNVSARPTNFRLQQMRDDSLRLGLPSYYAKQDTAAKQPNFFQNEFGNEPVDTSKGEDAPLLLAEKKEPGILKSARLGNYRLKFSSDYLVTQIDNSVLMNRYQPYFGWPQGPIRLQDPVNGLIRLGISDLMEDFKFSGAFRIPLALDGTEYMFSFSYLKKRFDYKLTYYRKVEKAAFEFQDGSNLPIKNKTNIYQAEVRYPFDQVRSLRLQAGLRTDELVVLANDEASLKEKNYKESAVLARLEYVHDNVLNPAINIYKGTRYKVYMDMIAQVQSNRNTLFGQVTPKGKFTYNMGIDARHYVEIHRNFIWATRFAADLSWGTRKLIYFLGGVDNWMIKPDIYGNRAPNPNENYAYQTLAVNMRGYKQNIRNGNNVMLINTELRLPVFTTFIDKPINSAFLRNFQLMTFVDLGTAWNEKLKFKDANYTEYTTPEGVVIRIKDGFLGPFVGGYGFGARTTVLGYFARFDAGWPMTGFFRGKPQLTFALGVDF